MKVHLKLGNLRITIGPETWLCFHCGFETADRREAQAHFGEGPDEEPLCRSWAELDADGRASEYQSAMGELEREREEADRLRTEVENLEHRLGSYESLVGSRFRGCRTIGDAFNLFDSMEGRALAAEQRLAELQKERTA